MPRQAILDYMMKRVTKHSPDFFEKYTQFQTSVTSVVYEEDEKFHVSTHSTVTGVTDTKLFDRCIWAAGDNGEANMPQAVLHKLHGFRGKIIHSTDTATLKDDVYGKRVLVIGGSYSAEDLALMSVKLGVERIYLNSRTNDNAISWTGEWPQNKVECVELKTPVAVENGSTIVLKETKWVMDETYRLVPDGEVMRLKDIDTIIMCTGYRQQFGMLEHKLRKWADDRMTSTFDVPDDWKMEENDDVPHLNDFPAPKKARYYGGSLHCDIYRGMLIDNPKMMFLRHDYDDYNILNADAIALSFLRYVTGDLEIPSQEEMRRQNTEQALYEMTHYPICRMYMDPDYGEEWKRTVVDPEWKLYEECENQFLLYQFCVMARTMDEANYPLSLGTYEALNENGKRLHHYGMLSYMHRVEATTTRTFRDIEDAEEFSSLFTGTKACPLKKLWMDIDENVEKDVV